MAALTPDFVHNLETQMRLIGNAEYQRLAASAAETKSLATEATSGSAKERLIWLWDTAGIQYVNKDGDEVEFPDQMSDTTLYEHKAATAGLKLKRTQFTDLDGNGVNLAHQWMRTVTEYASYWPRKQVMSAIKTGETGTTYDGLPFFATNHPNNPLNTPAGRYANMFTGAEVTDPAVGLNPGAKPIHEVGAGNVPLDTAVSNLFDAVNFVNGTLKMPNGEDPRMLKVRRIIYPTRLKRRVTDILQAKFIATNSGSQDIEATQIALGLQAPLEAPELGAGFVGGSDTDYYLEIDLPPQLPGALIYWVREPFQVIFNGPMTDSELNKANNLEWVLRGRNVVGYGHPFGLIKVKGA